MSPGASHRRRPATARKAQPITASTEPQRGDDGPSGWKDRVVKRSLNRARQRSLERGQAFIDAATQLLQEPSRDGFTVQEVADMAGQSLRTLYQHFQSKDDLLLAVFEEQLKIHTFHTRQEVDKYNDPLDRLTALIIASAGASSGVVGITVALTQYRMRLATTHPDELALVQAPYVSLASELIADAVQAHAIPPCNVGRTAYMITTLKSAYLHSQLLGNELGTELPTPLELARFCLEGVGGRVPEKFTLDGVAP